MLPRLLLPALLAAGLTPGLQEPVDRELLSTYFRTCDADDSGWLSFRECRDSLALDRAGFASFDTDIDYRVTLEEFEANYDEVTRRVGSLQVPVKVIERAPDLPRSTRQLLAAYDRNGDEAIQTSELIALLGEYGLNKLPAETVLANLDDNGDRSLSGVELERGWRMLQSLYATARAETEDQTIYTSIDQLFGLTVERPAAIDASRQPPLIVGPVLPFRRLDLDGDGGIEIDDLYRLLTPVTPSFSIGAIHAGLDLDEDGRIDRAELARSMGLQMPR